MRNRGRRGEGEDFARKNTEALPPLVGRGSGERNRHTANVAASQASLFPLCKLISTIAGEIVRRVKKLFKILNAGRRRRGGIRRATVHSLKPPPPRLVALLHCPPLLFSPASNPLSSSFVFYFLPIGPLFFTPLRPFCHLAGFSGYWFRFEQLFPFSKHVGIIARVIAVENVRECMHYEYECTYIPCNTLWMIMKCRVRG